ncbi:hypothetical protein [Oryzihumus leptocrescens]|uniref:Uncharacterized protein n=1 Tax=Oryzihumus leptocrescens TaxID=297536 RepID=A0A542ZH65_9MICO|nr:hypothetical protein [Oryzihumus leptocrescens]TQL59717.1 hypothetical protein FB474_1083 [Oryzihumus leptocrescens]
MGGGGFDVEIGQMDLAEQLFERQQGHMAAIRGYVSSTCSAPGAFQGLMSLLRGHYSGCLSQAETGLDHGGQVADHCASKIGLTRSTYLRMDKAAYDRFAEKEKAAGRTVAPYKPPVGGGSLGPARSDVPLPEDYAKAAHFSSTGYYEPGSVLGAAGSALRDTTKEVGAKVIEDSWAINDPETKPKPNWADTWRAGHYNSDLYNQGNGAGMDPSGGYRTPEDYAHETKVQSAFDQGYYRGSRYAAGHVPDGTAYSGAADQDGYITQNRRPGSTWAPHELGAPLELSNGLGELGEKTNGVLDGLAGARDAFESAKDVNDLAHGAANTAGTTWARTDKGGTW